MPWESLDDKLYRIFDEAVGLTMSNLRQASASNGKIQLLSFNRANIEHLYMLQVALIARDLFDVEVEIDAPWFDVLKINWKIRKNFRKIKKMSFDAGNGIPTNVLLNSMRNDMKKYYQSGDFSFGDVYHAYYEGSLN